MLSLAFGMLSAPALGAEDSGPEPLPRPVASTRQPHVGYAHVFGTAGVGRGLRFNNPYRLATQLGESGESLSLSATYLDFGLGTTWVGSGSLEHGGVLHLSVALSGIPQEVLSFSYIGQRRIGREFLLYGRAGIPVIIEPDINAGLELATGATWLLRAGLGLNAELVGSLFYGAGTIERSVTTIPLLSLQVGVAVDYEVLP